MCLVLIPPANCGAPPTEEGLTVTLSGPYTRDQSNAIVANRGAMATYECTDATLVLTGDNVLECVSDSANDVPQWDAEAVSAECEPGEI